MKPIQLPLGVRLRDDATFANYYPGANAAALGYVERLCEADAGWTESLIYLWGAEGVGRSHLLQAACLRFEQRGGMLRNILTRQVPALAAERAEEALRLVMGRAGLAQQDIGAWILHAGGRDVLKAIERGFALGPQDLRYSADVLRRYGNLSSAFVYFVLDAALAGNAPGRWWWLSAFGAGFSCHGALLRVR